MASKLSEEAILARRAYNREYYHSHKEQREKSHAKHWEKVAQELAKKQQTQGAANE